MQLYSQRLTALTDSENAPELVLLHGWAMSSCVWQGWLPTLREHCNITLIDLPGYGDSEPVADFLLEHWLAQCIELLPAKAVYCGYSLGGMLATQLAYHYPERVSALITLATNLRFVADDQWPLAMNAKTYEDFYRDVEQKPVQALKKFASLQLYGLVDEKPLLKALRTRTESFSEGVLTQSLQLLSSIDNRPIINKLTVPALHVFGREDKLVPVAVADSVAEKLQTLSNTHVAVIEGAPHLLFQSHAQQCWQAVEQFLHQCAIIKNRVRSKKQVARSFSRAAASYDSVAELQRQVGQTLLKTLPQTAAHTVLDLGCGTGFFCPLLQQRFPNSQIVGLDLAEGMAAYAAKKHASTHYVCGDAESIPLADASIDIVFSSLAIQWCEDNDALFSELFRILKPGAYIVFSTLGPDTLHELRDAWCAVDDYIHVNRFVGRDVLKASITKAGFNVKAYEAAFNQETITLEYDTLKELTRELKSLGAHNVNSGRPVGLTGKQRLRRFIDAYELQRNAQGLLPATYQSWYGLLQKPLISEVSI